MLNYFSQISVICNKSAALRTRKRSPQQWPEGVINATTRNAQRKKGNVGTASNPHGCEGSKISKTFPIDIGCF